MTLFIELFKITDFYAELLKKQKKQDLLTYIKIYKKKRGN